MARFGVYAVKGVNGYLVDVQSDLLRDIATRVVVPLVPAATGPRGLPRLNPTFVIEDVAHILVPQQIGTVPKRLLQEPAADLTGESEKITAAVDFLMQGF